MRRFGTQWHPCSGQLHRADIQSNVGHFDGSSFCIGTCERDGPCSVMGANLECKAGFVIRSSRILKTTELWSHASIWDPFGEPGQATLLEFNLHFGVWWHHPNEQFEDFWRKEGMKSCTMADLHIYIKGIGWLYVTLSILFCQNNNPLFGGDLNILPTLNGV